MAVRDSEDELPFIGKPFDTAIGRSAGEFLMGND
jgi:hypothetical protein